MLHTKFRQTLSTGCREDFKWILPYTGMAAILLMCQASFQLIFFSMYLKAYIQNLVQIGEVVSEKSRF